MLKRGICYLLVVYFLSASVMAIGISPAQMTVNFEPSLQQNMSVVVLNGGLRDANVSISFSGDLTSTIRYTPEYIIVPSGGMHTFNFLLDFPAQIKKPGKHLVQVHAVEYPLGETKGIVPLTAVSASLYIVVPYTVKYAELEILTHDVNIGEPVTFTLFMTNFALQDIVYAVAMLTVFNSREELVQTLVTKPAQLQAQSTTETTLVLQTAPLPAGSYIVKALFDYDGEQSPEQQLPFRIGTLSVAILNYTRDFTTEQINKFLVDIESKWNSKVEQLYGEISILKDNQPVGNLLKTPSVTLEPWERKTITTFFDTRGLEPGTYTTKIMLYYHNVTTEETGIILIHKPFTLNLVYILTGVIILIILFDLILFYRHHRRNHEED